MIRIATICLAAYWIVIFVATHLPSRSLPRLSASDSSLHTIGYAGLAFLLAWAIPTRNRLRHAAIVLGIAIGYSIFDELTQNLIPGRSCELRDVIADSTGALIGLVCYTICRETLTYFALGRKLISTLSR